MQNVTVLMGMGLLIGCASGAEEAVSVTSQALCTGEGQGGEGCCPGSPIIVDLGGDGIHLTSTEAGVLFDLHPGRLGHWAWTAPGSDDALLVLDRDGDGIINDGGELFGDGATQVASATPNGFAALAYFDLPAQGGNGDGVIDGRDAVWSRLQLWRDSDHDAWSAPDELISMASAGVRSFSLNAVPSGHVDEHGNEFRFSAPIVADAPVGRVASDVWLVQSPIPVISESARAPGILTDFIHTCTSWYYSVEIASTRLECLSPPVINDPVVVRSTLPWVQKLRRVARTFSALNDHGAAHVPAENAVVQATTTCNNSWSFSYTLFGDPFRPIPPLLYENSFPSQPRTKCRSTPVPVGGGGGCSG